MTDYLTETLGTARKDGYSARFLREREDDENEETIKDWQSYYIVVERESDGMTASWLMYQDGSFDGSRIADVFSKEIENWAIRSFENLIEEYIPDHYQPLIEE